MTNNVSHKWEELKALVESLEDDVQKKCWWQQGGRHSCAKRSANTQVHGG